MGLSQNGLLHYFGSKDALFTEVLRHHERAVAVDVDPEHTDFSEGFAERLMGALDTNLREAGMSQLVLRLATEATEPGHAAHDTIVERYTAFREYGTTALISLQEKGRFPADADPAATAAILAAAFDGLQMQWQYDRSFDIRAHLVYLLRTLGVQDVPESEEAAK